ncbi:hypothetical protein GCM10027074_07980 [Streptomyces deserti]
MLHGERRGDDEHHRQGEHAPPFQTAPRLQPHRHPFPQREPDALPLPTPRLRIPELVHRPAGNPDSRCTGIPGDTDSRHRRVRGNTDGQQAQVPNHVSSPHPRIQGSAHRRHIPVLDIGHPHPRIQGNTDRRHIQTPSIGKPHPRIQGSHVHRPHTEIPSRITPRPARRLPRCAPSTRSGIRRRRPRPWLPPLLDVFSPLGTLAEEHLRTPPEFFRRRLTLPCPASDMRRATVANTAVGRGRTARAARCSRCA